jgi:partitioning defective protein 6
LDRSETSQFLEFHSLIKSSHHLPTDMPFTISYTDPRNGDLLPINNDDNMLRAFGTAQPLLRIFVYRERGMFEPVIPVVSRWEVLQSGWWKGTGRDAF